MCSCYIWQHAYLVIAIGTAPRTAYINAAHNRTIASACSTCCSQSINPVTLHKTGADGVHDGDARNRNCSRVAEVTQVKYLVVFDIVTRCCHRQSHAVAAIIYLRCGSGVGNNVSYNITRNICHASLQAHAGAKARSIIIDIGYQVIGKCKVGST